MKFTRPIVKRFRLYWRYVAGLSVVIGIVAGTITISGKWLGDDTSTTASQEISEDAGIVPAETVEAIRAISGVRSLRATEESAQIEDLPAGVFGYASSRFISSYIGTLGVDKLPLSRSKGEVSDIEVHKTSGGEVLVLVYVSEGDLSRLQRPGAQGDFEIFVLFEPIREYRFVIAIQATSLLDWDSRSGEDLGRFARLRIR